MTKFVFKRKLVIFNDVELSRFWDKVSKSHGCWTWTAYRDKAGYGQSHIARAPIGAHRLSWLIHYGEIGSGLCVLHSCDNPSCVNPDHLWLGTHLDNNRDRAMKGRSASGDNHPRRLHPELWKDVSEWKFPDRRGAFNQNSVLNARDVLNIRARFESGDSGTKLAREYGVQHACIYKIVHRKTWKHV